MRSSWLVTLAVTSAACADGAGELTPPPPDPPTSNPRLVPFGYDAREGATVVTSIWDTELGIRCRPERDAEGTWRCLPPGITFLSPQPEIFADADCTIPAVSVSGRRRTPRFIKPGTSVCASQSRAEVFEAVGVPQEVAYARTEAGCRPGRGGFMLQPPFLGLAPRAPDRFVRLIRDVRPLDGDLARVTFSTEAGATFDWEVVDRRDETTCTPMSLAGADVCGPLVAGFDRSGEISCSGAAAVGGFSSDFDCRRPTRIVARDVEWCGPSKLLRFELPRTDCSADSDNPGASRAFRAREVDPAAELLPLARSTAGGGRIRATYFAAQDGTVLHRRTATLFDTALDVACEARSFGGTLRCLPTPSAAVQPAFADPACEVPLDVAVVRYQESAVPEVGIEIDLYDNPATAPIQRTWAIEEELSPASIYSQFGTPDAACLPISASGYNPSCARYFRLGALQDPSTYAEVREGPLE